MDMQELNQLVIDQTMIVHDHCMDHCLDKDSEAYRFWSSQRDHVVTLCKAAALSSKEQTAYVTRFNSHQEPFKQRFYRIRAENARTMNELQAAREAACSSFYDDDGYPVVEDDIGYPDIDRRVRDESVAFERREHHVEIIFDDDDIPF